jgi:hypothetical protein
MKQALHIFRKDTLAFRIEIGLFVLFAAIFAAGGASVIPHMVLPEIFLQIPGIFLIARVIHAEPIPGDRQFWITRPYNWRSLAAAKLLFIAAFVSAPICIAQIVMLIAGGFPFAVSLPGLIWSQLLTFCMALVVVTLATLTAGTRVFVLSVFTLVSVGSIWTMTTLGGIPKAEVAPAALGWLREYSAIAAVTVIAGIILVWQYRSRATTLGRWAGAGGVVAAIALFSSIPASLALALETHLSKAAAPDSITISIDRNGIGSQVSNGRDPEYRLTRIFFPLVIQGLPSGTEARGDLLDIQFALPGNPAWKPAMPAGLNPRPSAPGVSSEEVTVLMDADLYARNLRVPITVSGSIYLTLFGETEVRTAHIGSKPANFQDGLQCLTQEFNLFYCRRFFRWPSALVYADSGGTRYELGNSLISYSPFPANAGFYPMEGRSGGTAKTSELTVTTRKPIAHFWHHFEVRDVRLSQF